MSALSCSQLRLSFADMSRDLLYRNQFVSPPLEDVSNDDEAKRRLMKQRFRQYYESQLGRPVFRSDDRLLIRPSDAPKYLSSYDSNAVMCTIGNSSRWSLLNVPLKETAQSSRSSASIAKIETSASIQTPIITEFILGLGLKT